MLTKGYSDVQTVVLLAYLEQVSHFKIDASAIDFSAHNCVYFNSEQKDVRHRVHQKQNFKDGMLLVPN